MDSFIQWAVSNTSKNQSRTISIRVIEQNKSGTKEMLVGAVWLWYDTDGGMVMRTVWKLLFLHLAMLLPQRHAREHI